MMDVNARPNRRLRCAIYTRKSSDEGLDQGFNTLDAQYEACAAYIESQKHEGWNGYGIASMMAASRVAIPIARVCSACSPRWMPVASA